MTSSDRTGLRRLRKAAGVAVVAGVFGVLAAPVASAGEGDCAKGYFCIWRDSNYKTNTASNPDIAFVKLFQYIPNYGLWTYDTTTVSAANSATSLKNNSQANNTVYMYKGTNGTGSRYGIAALGARSNLATSLAPISWNDDIESAYFSAWDPNS